MGFITISSDAEKHSRTYSLNTFNVITSAVFIKSIYISKIYE